MGWELLVLDDNEYPPGTLRLQQQLAVDRRARSIARAHGGFALGTVSDRAFAFLVHPGPPPVLRQRPGSHPPIPAVPEPASLPPGNLALTPDNQPIHPPGLDGLDMLQLSENAGAGMPIAAQLTGLVQAQDERDWTARLHELIQLIMPGGTSNADTAPAASILSQLLLGNAFHAVRRCGIYWLLIEAASRYVNDVISSADIVAATGQPPRPLRWSQQARDTVCAAISDLLTRSDIEPPANRLALATLAALYRSHDQTLVDHITVMAAEQHGTTVGNCAQIAGQLITGHAQEAVRNAKDMYLTSRVHTTFDIDNSVLDPADLAVAILSEQVCDQLARLLPAALSAPLHQQYDVMSATNVISQPRYSLAANRTQSS